MSDYTALEDWFATNTQNGRFVVMKPLCWEIGKLGSELFVVVPFGTEFDVSVPRALHWFVRPDDPRFMKAAALHDYTLSNGWDRVAAAALFSDGLKADGVGKVKRLLCVLAVIAWHWS